MITGAMMCETLLSKEEYFNNKQSLDVVLKMYRVILFKRTVLESNLVQVNWDGGWGIKSKALGIY